MNPAKIITLWRSGKKGKTIIIVCSVVVLGILGQIFGEDESATSSVSANAPQSASAAKKNAGSTAKKNADPLEVDQSYLENASQETARANNDLVPVIKGTSIMTIAQDVKKWSKEYQDLASKYDGHGPHRDEGELGHPLCARRQVEGLYSEAFFSPVTHEKAKIDPGKSRFCLFGGAIKMGDTITIPDRVAADENACEFTVKSEKSATKVIIFRLHHPISVADGRSRHLLDKSQVWYADYPIKKFMGFENVSTLWYREGGSNELVMFWCETKCRDAGDSKQARETRAKFEAAIKAKCPDMEKTYHSKIRDEFIVNGDILELMQSPVPKEGGFFDAPYIKISMITPSVVDKLLKVIDEMIKKDFEAFKKKEQSAFENF